MNQPDILSQVASLGARPKLKQVEATSLDYYRELGKIAHEIVQMHSAFNLINANDDSFAADRIALRLTSAEQEFFLLFNNLRTSKGYEPLEGKRFTGEFSYDSYLYNY